MEYFYRAIYRKVCELVELKEDTKKKLNMIYLKIHDFNADRAPLYLFNPLDKTPVEDEDLDKWMCKWKVMEYLKISKSTYYRWREEGKLVPRNTIGEDRYLLEDMKNIVKKRNG